VCYGPAQLLTVAAILKINGVFYAVINSIKDSSTRVCGQQHCAWLCETL
jgi:hypothetical protein